MPESTTPLRNISGPIINIVEDDVSMRESLIDLFQSMNLQATAFASPEEFLERAELARPGCIVLDVRLPGLNGLDLQQYLEKTGSTLPIVFMTGFGDISMSVRAMKAGAIDFLTKPFRDQDMLDSVLAAIEQDSVRRRKMRDVDGFSSRMDALSPRERDVLQAVVEGLMNKQIAYRLGLSEITVKLHRASMMKKMEVTSVAELVRANERMSRHRALKKQADDKRPANSALRSGF